jgi:Chaperonin 10 Kd subunit
MMACRAMPAAAAGYGVQRRHRVTVLLLVVVVIGGWSNNANLMVHSWTITTTTNPISRAAVAAALHQSPLRTSTLVRTTAPINSMLSGNSSRRRTVLPPLRLSDDTDSVTATTTEQAATASLATIYTLDGLELNGPLCAVSNRIVVKVRDTLTATSGGILLPDQSQQRPTEGYVLVSGPGRVHPHSGVRIPNPIAPGMSVV